MEFRLLGPVEAWADGTKVDLGPAKRRAVLAILLLEVGRVVPIDRLVDLLWADDPPEAARRVIIVHISRLRAALHDAGAPAAGVELVTSGTGYSLVLGSGSVDAVRFREAVADAAGIDDPATRADVLRSALALWRGPALADVDEPLRHRVGAGLEALRCAAIEDRIDADLDCGRHADLGSELAELVAAYPRRERLVGQMMLAAYRSGVAADAVAAYNRLRADLADELGVDPGTRISDLFRRILSNDPDLDYRPPSAGTPSGPVPRQLPADMRGFEGRHGQLADFDRIAADGRSDMPIIAISGMGGIGKTALAVRWARQAADRYPDGQLYANLHGYSGSVPVPALEVLAGFLRGLGVPTTGIPSDLDECGQLFRSMLADRRTVVVLDNAVDAEHVRPLLPGSPGSVVVITSRDRLTGLAAVEGAYLCALDVLEPPDAIAVLGRFLGPDVTGGEPEATATLAEICNRLPLALRIAAARFPQHPAGTLAGYVAELTSGGTLAALTTGGDDRASVRAVIEWSYQRLDAPAARAFRLLGAQPLPDFDRYAAAAVIDAEPDDLLRALVDASLLDRAGTGRFTMHDLLAGYAIEVTPAADRAAATVRLADYVRAAAGAAMDVYLPVRRHQRPVVEPADWPPPPLAGSAVAAAWLDTEIGNIVLLGERHADLPRHAIDLAQVVSQYLHNASRNIEALALHTSALAAAERLGDGAAEAEALLSLGRLQRLLGRPRAAIPLLERSLRVRRRAGDDKMIGATLAVLGASHSALGDLDRGLEYQVAAYDAHEQANDPLGMAMAANAIGLDHVRHSRLDEAEPHFEEALGLAIALGDRSVEVNVRCNMGTIYHRKMQLTRAIEQYRPALEHARAFGRPVVASSMLRLIGSAQLSLGRFAEAEATLREGIEIATRIDARDELVGNLSALGHTHLTAGDLVAAEAVFQSGLRLAREIGMRSGETQILLGLGSARAKTGDTVAAEAYLTDSAAVARAIGEPDTEAEAIAGLAAIALIRRDVGAAVALAERALAIVVPTSSFGSEIVVRHALADALSAADRHPEAATHRQAALALEARIS